MPGQHSVTPDHYYRSNNAWKPSLVGGRQAWVTTINGHRLYAQTQEANQRSYNWWVTSDRSGSVITAKGVAKTFAMAQQEAMAEVRKLAPGMLSPSSFLPSELRAIKDGTLRRLELGGLGAANER